MVVLIAGETHTGKTRLAQMILEKYGYPYLSLDHLKMGFIRGGVTALTPDDDAELTPYIWRIAREIVKTAIENGQNLTVEGCYIPFDFADDLEPRYLDEVRFVCLAMSENYILRHWDSICGFENIIEKRMVGGADRDEIIRGNARSLELCGRYGLCCHLFDDEYDIESIISDKGELYLK